MIDLNETQNTKALLKEWCKQGMESISTPVKYGQLLDLMNRLASSEKDAARYRWLRESTHFDSMQHKLYCLHYGERLDIAIDEAMQCSN